MPEPLPDFPFDASPRTDHCEKCGAGPDADLRFLIVRGRTRYLGRTLCDICSEEILEGMLLAEAEPEAGSSS